MSRRFLKSAQYSVHKLLEKATDLSFQSRHDYRKGLMLAMKQLHEQGSQIANICDLKKKHVEKLVQYWKSENLSPATIKNRVSQLRYVCRMLDKKQLIPDTNKELELPARVYYATKNRAISHLDIDRFNDSYVKHSIKLQQLFGLRREESIKFIPIYADRGQYIVLKGSWTKGGIERKILITNKEQRDYLNRLKHEIPAGSSLIPTHKSYRQQQHAYVREVRNAGYKNLHGLRHAYAQTRYREITDELSNGRGWDCPRRGGPRREELSAEEQVIDEKARLLISNQLGHSRKEIVKVYIN